MKPTKERIKRIMDEWFDAEELAMLDAAQAIIDQWSEDTRPETKPLTVEQIETIIGSRLGRGIGIGKIAEIAQAIHAAMPSATLDEAHQAWKANEQLMARIKELEEKVADFNKGILERNEANDTLQTQVREMRGALKVYSDAGGDIAYEVLAKFPEEK